MSWVVIAAAGPKSDLSEIASVASTSRIREATDDASLAAAVRQATTEGADRIAVVGTDRDLAIAAGAVLDAPVRPALALVPTQASDIHRMFGLDRRAAIGRLQAGSRYPADLGRVRGSFGEHFFVGSVAASRIVRMWWLMRADPIRIETRRGVHEHRASLVVAANAQHLQGRTIAPRAALMDGALDVQSFGGTLRWRLRAWSAAERALHFGLRTTWRRSFGAAVLMVPQSWVIRADGRRLGLGPFSVEAIPLAFDLWI